MKRAFKIIWGYGILRVSFLITFALFLSSLLIYIFESSRNEQFNSILDGLWWAVVTMTTVGYGDKVPATTLGKIVAFLLMFSGVVLISIFTATVSSIFVTKRIKEMEGFEKVDTSEHTIICGWNKDAERILKALNQLAKKKEMEIVLINSLQLEKVRTLIETYKNIEIKFVYGDFTQESVLERANVREAKEVIILPDETSLSTPSDEKTLIATLNIKSINPKIKVYAYIIDRNNASNLKKAGADEVIISNDYIPTLLAGQILSPGLIQVLSTLFNEDSPIKIFRVKIPPKFIGKTYLELFNYFKTEENYLLIGFISDEEFITLESILSHDYTEIDAFIERKLKEAGLNLKSQYVKLNLNPPLNYIIGPKEHAIVIGNIKE